MNLYKRFTRLNRAERRFRDRCARKIQELWDKITNQFHKELFNDYCHDGVFKTYNAWWIHNCRWLRINRPNAPIQPDEYKFYEYAISQEI